MYPNLHTEILPGRVGLVQINRPTKLNALNSDTLHEIATAATAYDQDPQVGAIVLTGNARAFAAGADIAEFAATDLPSLMAGTRHDQYQLLARVKKPLVAAVSGFAFGGGCELAMICDVIVASDTARFAQPEINLGLIPGGGGTQRLTGQLGKYWAMEVVLAGRQLGAWEAYRHGLVNRVVPVELYLEEAIELARKMAAQAPLAARLAKESIQEALEGGLEQGLHYERRSFYLAYGSQDAREGLQAFTEKRKAQWKGQ